MLITISQSDMFKSYFVHPIIQNPKTQKQQNFTFEKLMLDISLWTLKSLVIRLQPAAVCSGIL